MSFLDKPWFGAVPPYLQQRMREIEAQRQRAEQADHEDEVSLSQWDCGFWVESTSCRILAAAATLCCCDQQMLRQVMRTFGTRAAHSRQTPA